MRNCINELTRTASGTKAVFSTWLAVITSVTGYKIIECKADPCPSPNPALDEETTFWGCSLAGFYGCETLLGVR